MSMDQNYSNLVTMQNFVAIGQRVLENKGLIKNKKKNNKKNKQPLENRRALNAKASW